jgi:hypothetical protein
MRRLLIRPARKERALAKWINAPVELFRKLTTVHDWEISHHEQQAQACRRRAATAAQGDRLDTQDERLDA